MKNQNKGSSASELKGYTSEEWQSCQRPASTKIPLVRVRGWGSEMLVKNTKVRVKIIKRKYKIVMGIISSKY